MKGELTGNILILKSLPLKNLVSFFFTSHVFTFDEYVLHGKNGPLTILKDPL